MVQQCTILELYPANPGHHRNGAHTMTISQNIFTTLQTLNDASKGDYILVGMSAELGNCSASMNHCHTMALAIELKRADTLAVWNVDGVYFGSVERSFLALIDRKNLGDLIDLASKYQQESIIVIHTEGHCGSTAAFLQYLQGDGNESVGELHHLATNETADCMSRCSDGSSFTFK